MKKLINKLFAGKVVTTSKGSFKFDENGVVIVEDNIADSFVGIPTYEVETSSDQDTSDKLTDEINENSEITEIKSDGEDDKENGAETNEEDTDEETINLESLTVPALKKYAKDNDIDVSGLTNKEQLLKAIRG